jgi:hypothetical protein
MISAAIRLRDWQVWENILSAWKLLEWQSDVILYSKASITTLEAMEIGPGTTIPVGLEVGDRRKYRQRLTSSE